MRTRSKFFYLDAIFIGITTAFVGFFGLVRNTSGFLIVAQTSMLHKMVGWVNAFGLLELGFIMLAYGLFFFASDQKKLRFLRVISLFALLVVSAPVLRMRTLHLYSCLELFLFITSFAGIAWVLTQPFAFKSAIQSRQLLKSDNRWLSVRISAMHLFAFTYLAIAFALVAKSSLLLIIVAIVTFVLCSRLFEHFCVLSSTKRKIGIILLALISGLSSKFYAMILPLWGIWLDKSTRGILSFMATPERQIRASIAMFLCCGLAIGLCSMVNIPICKMKSCTIPIIMMVNGYVWLKTANNPIAMMFPVWIDMYCAIYSNNPEVGSIIAMLPVIGAIRLLKFTMASCPGKRDKLILSATSMISAAHVLYSVVACHDVLMNARLKFVGEINVLLTVFAIFSVNRDLKLSKSGRTYSVLWQIFSVVVIGILVFEAKKHRYLCLAVPIFAIIGYNIFNSSFRDKAIDSYSCAKRKIEKRFRTRCHVYFGYKKLRRCCNLKSSRDEPY